MKKRIKKLLSITLSACMILPVFSVSVVEAKPEETIRVWYWEDNDGSYADAYDTWSEQYPDVNLELEAIPWNSYHDTLIAAAASGDLPDVYKIQPTWIPELRSLNAVAKLDEYMIHGKIKIQFRKVCGNRQERDRKKHMHGPIVWLYCISIVGSHISKMQDLNIQKQWMNFIRHVKH